jgi:hypothetical protein
MVFYRMNNVSQLGQNKWSLEVTALFQFRVKTQLHWWKLAPPSLKTWIWGHIHFPCVQGGGLREIQTCCLATVYTTCTSLLKMWPCIKLLWNYIQEISGLTVNTRQVSIIWNTRVKLNMFCDSRGCAYGMTIYWGKQHIIVCASIIPMHEPVSEWTIHSLI